MDERPSELELLAREVTKQGRRGKKAAKPPQAPALSGGPPQPNKSGPTFKEHLLYLAFVAFVFFGVYGGCWYCLSPIADAPLDTESRARIIAERFVKAAMSFPEEASFPGVFSDAHRRAIKSEEGVWRIIGEVVGKNAFGVRIRHGYRCNLKFVGGEPYLAQSWELLALEFYDP